MDGCDTVASCLVVKMTPSDILKGAADVLEERGMNRGSSIHKRSGKVDLWGALCLAGGARPEELGEDTESIEEYVPQAHIVPVLEAYLLLKEFVGIDPIEWADGEGSTVVIQLLRDLGYYLQFSLIQGE